MLGGPFVHQVPTTPTRTEGAYKPSAPLQLWFARCEWETGTKPEERECVCACVRVRVCVCVCVSGRCVNSMEHKACQCWG